MHMQWSFSSMHLQAQACTLERLVSTKKRASTPISAQGQAQAGKRAGAQSANSHDQEISPRSQSLV